MNEFRRDLDVSLRFVWLLSSLVILLILASPFVLGSTRVQRLAPVCESRLHDGRPCAFCGMTTGFLAISEGRFHDAGRANHAAIPLYAAFVINEIAVLMFVRKGGLICKSSA
jgi:hypothetical protein